MIKEMIKELNRAMFNNEISFVCVKNILSELSVLTSKNYGVLNCRVIIMNADGSFNDAYVNC